VTRSALEERAGDRKVNWREAAGPSHAESGVVMHELMNIEEVARI